MATSISFAAGQENAFFKLKLNTKTGPDCRVTVYEKLDGQSIVIKKFIRDQDYNDFKINEQKNLIEISLPQILGGKSDRHIFSIQDKKLILKYRLFEKDSNTSEVFESIISDKIGC
jgi:hypothetical protein